MNEFMSKMAVPTATPAEPRRTCRDTINTMHDELNELNTMLQSLAGFVGVEPPSPTDKPVNCLPEDLMQMAEQLDADLACINRVCDVLGVCISLNA